MTAVIDLREMLIDPSDAQWVGHQAARKGVVASARAMVPQDMLDAYDTGAGMGPNVRVYAQGIGDSERRQIARVLARLANQSEPAQLPDLPVTIRSLTQRADVGTATRYDLELACGDRVAMLRDLRASDLLAWERLRPIACDARMVLPSLRRGTAAIWTAAVQAAMDNVIQAEMGPEDSEAMEVRGLLVDLTTSARSWAWTEDEPYPSGIARIEWLGRVGWPRGPILREVRTSIGKVSRVAIRRACDDLGWMAQEWNIEQSYLRVWSRKS